jgi:hypothetical protein
MTCCRCGHLFCWSCLYNWTRRQPSCPVCKDLADETRVVPIYTRQSPAASSSSSSQAENGVRIPPRPAGLRLLMPPDALRRNGAAAAQNQRVVAATQGRQGHSLARTWVWWLSCGYHTAYRPPILSPQMQTFLMQLLTLTGSLLVLFVLLW